MFLVGALANSTDRMSAIMDLKLNHERESNTADLRIYSQLANLKKQKIKQKRYFSEIQSALYNVDVRNFKVQNVYIKSW